MLRGTKKTKQGQKLRLLLLRRAPGGSGGLLLLSNDLDPAAPGASPVDPRAAVAAVERILHLARRPGLEALRGELCQKPLERERELVAVAAEEQDPLGGAAPVVAHDLRERGPQRDGLSRFDGPRRRVGVLASWNDVRGRDLRPDEAGSLFGRGRRRRGDRLEDACGSGGKGADADAVLGGVLGFICRRRFEVKEVFEEVEEMVRSKVEEVV